MKAADVKIILLFVIGAIMLSLLVFNKASATPASIITTLPLPVAAPPVEMTLPVAAPPPKTPAPVVTPPPVVVATPTPSVSLRVLQPMYNPPQDQSFTDLVNAALLYPSRIIYAVVNPANGPISAEAAINAGYVSIMTSIVQRCPNVFFLGYCDTASGGNSIEVVEGLIASYLSWQNGGVKIIHGAFLDDFDFVNVGYVQALAAYCNANELYSLGNPGTSLPSASYSGTLDGWVVYENPGPLPSYQTVLSAEKGAQADFFFMSYGVTWGSSVAAAIQSISPAIAGFYVGPGSATNSPYATPQTTAYLQDSLGATS